MAKEDGVVGGGGVHERAGGGVGGGGGWQRIGRRSGEKEQMCRQRRGSGTCHKTNEG